MWHCYHIYMELSKLKAKCKPSSVACERRDVVDSQTGHYNHKFRTAAVAVK
jgi:hypothetical protein